ncbi:hypothetical protein Zmor_000198 [Zophobas morio]|uniref:Saccharopine dehydrogenase NADP binding domain-containing protein n=1 Tax=Zophobas morio TaxID=2755281 RepID=A0AA38J274_9CUCU|nr:hypothetical protein Zmor_000198 [Zophobas morio]
MTRDLDIILFGATGFTGKHALPLIAKFAKAKNRNLTWGVAGRNENKLKDFLEQCEKDTGTPLSDVPIIIADVQDDKSLTDMARKARIVVNCCGPYRFFGEPVVKACVEVGTHHVDIAGEPEYAERIQLKYNDKAREKGVYIVSSCGFDSIPADLGLLFVQKKFDGTLNSVVSYLESWQEGQDIPGPVLNYGTWESAIYGAANAGQLKAQRRQLFPMKLPNFKPKLQRKARPHKNDHVDGWVLPFPGADRAVMERSQRLFYEKDQKRPAQIETYFIIKSFWNVVLVAFFGSIFQLLAKFKCGRNLLLKYPEKFSAGFFSRESPSEEKIKNMHFSVTLFGEGWKGKLADGNDQYSTPPDKLISVKVKGSNPGYGATCVSLLLAAITILTEPEKMPSEGGVYPPGYAFANTTLIEQLNENGLTFDVLFEKDLSHS